MSSSSSRKSPSDCEAQCPDCGVTISRLADLNRHRKSKHSNGSENKIPCPHVGCRYKAVQKSNLISHLNARHSNGPRYPCPECNGHFSDAAARIRHRKRIHGYVPHHTKEYLARQALKRKERAVQETNEAPSDESRHQPVTPAAPDGLPNASPCAPPFNLPEFGYHDDFWKVLVDVARSYTPEPQHSQDVPPALSLPFATMPGYDTSSSIQPFSMQPTAQLQPFPTPLDFTTDYSNFLGPHLDPMLSQGQSFGELLTGDYGMPPYNDFLNVLPQ